MNERAAIPMLSYEDVAAAVDWLTDAFGFREVGERYDDGRVTHAVVSVNRQITPTTLSDLFIGLRDVFERAVCSAKA